MSRIVVCAWLVAGCARFVDERPATTADLADALGNDDGGDDDAGPVVLAGGSFTGRAGHSGAGTASLVHAGGSVRLELGSDFAVTGVPGPEVVLTSRDALGTLIDLAFDVDLGPLESASGAQSYALPGGADIGRRNVFIFCKPFGVEVALAVLSP